MPPLDLTLCLRMIWRTTKMLHVFVLQPFSQLARDVAGAVVAEQSWLMNDVNLVATRSLQSKVERVRHIFCPHVGA